jgi:hypothetical protein
LADKGPDRADQARIGHDGVIHGLSEKWDKQLKTTLKSSCPHLFF